jgi:hypothetical protein
MWSSANEVGMGVPLTLPILHVKFEWVNSVDAPKPSPLGISPAPGIQLTCADDEAEEQRRGNWEARSPTRAGSFQRADLRSAGRAGVELLEVGSRFDGPTVWAGRRSRLRER